MKSSRKLRFSGEANGWHKWSEKFANYKTSRISTLVRFLSIDSLEEIFISQATLDMLRPLRFHHICLEILKKTDVKDWWRPNICNMKYGIRIP